MSFSLTSPPLARALADRNYSDPTPVQSAVLEDAARGRDLLVSSQTGSGKTIAYGLAIGETLLGTAERLGPAEDAKDRRGNPDFRRKLVAQIGRLDIHRWSPVSDSGGWGSEGGLRPPSDPHPLGRCGGAFGSPYLPNGSCTTLTAQNSEIVSAARSATAIAFSTAVPFCSSTTASLAVRCAITPQTQPAAKPYTPAILNSVPDSIS